MQFPEKRTAIVVILLLFVSALSIVSYASPLNVQSQNSQALGGVYYDVKGNYNVTSVNFAVASTDKTAANTWSNGGTCNTALTAGHWFYNVTVTANTGAAASTITVYIDSGSGYTTLGTITFTQTPTANDKCNFYFDAGTSINNVNAIYITMS